MNLIVRFYWQHDLDLVALVKHPDFKMETAMKDALKAYVRGDKDFSIPLPPPKPYRLELDSCYIHFTLDHEKDQDIIEFLKTIRYGFRNSALKMILRQYLVQYNMDVFFDDQLYAAKSRGREKVQKLPGKAPYRPITKKDNVPQNTLTDAGNTTGSDKKADLSTTSATSSGNTDRNITEESTVSETIITNDESNDNNLLDPSAEITNETPVDLDLSEEENDSLEGSSFDLFSALDKLM